MKNKIEFPENNTFEAKQFINQISAGSSFNKIYSDITQNQSFNPSKIIRGKVKIHGSNSRQNSNNDWLDDEEELEIVWKRMLLFVKFIFLFLIVSSVFILIQKNVH